MEYAASRSAPTHEENTMDRGGTEYPSSEDLRVLLETTQVPGIQDVRSVEDGISVAFPEADFVISMSSPAAAPRCDTEWEVTVREPLPGLNTWWGRWQRSFSVQRADVAPLIAEELQGAIERVRGMLDDHARSAAELRV